MDTCTEEQIHAIYDIKCPCGCDSELSLYPDNTLLLKQRSSGEIISITLSKNVANAIRKACLEGNSTNQTADPTIKIERLGE